MTDEKKKTQDGGGLRFNQGKLPLEMVPVSTSKAIAEVLRQATERKVNPYPPRNWERGMRWTIVMGCLERHYNDFKNPRESDFDSDSKLHHLKHVLTNVAFLIEYLETCPELDDRPKREVKELENVENKTK